MRGSDADTERVRHPRDDRSQHPSRLWTALVLATTCAVVAAVIAALVINTRARRPIGEGQLFAADGITVTQAIDGRAIADEDLRHMRNALKIEAVSLVGQDAVVRASTSSSLANTALSSSLLAGFVERGRFGAVAAPLDVPILVDGVEEWSTGDIVYQVVQPLSDGHSVLLTYDISELLTRRQAARATPTVVIELLGLSALGAAASIGLFAARSRAIRTYREFGIESEYLRREANALALHNAELDEARRRAERAYELAEEKNRIRSEFVLMINHELRTPLTGVLTGAELIRELGGTADPVLMEVVGHVIEDGARLREMIDQILVVARIENGGLFFELQRVPLTEVIERIALGRPRYEVPDVDGVGDASLLTDTTTLVGLIQSLADNAFTHGASSARLRVAHSCPFEPMLEAGARPRDAIYLVIEDDGPGIDPEFLPRVFEKFEKHSHSSGTGLGLYIARMMVEALGGSLLLTTSPAGSSVAVALPSAASRVAAR